MVVQRPWMNDELTMLAKTARRFAEVELVPNEERWGKQQHVDREVWLKAGAAGLLCPSISEEYGGGGGNVLHEAAIFYEQARAVAPGMGNAVHSGIVAHYLKNFASAEQKREWLPKMASGELVGAIAMSEPGAGSDLLSIRTQAIRHGDYYVINGSKTWISNGLMADLILVVCKTDPAAGHRGISVIVVEPAKVEGFRRGKPLNKIGLHSQDTAELFFEDMRVPTANLLGPDEGNGFKQLMKELPRERVITAIVAQAYMDRAVEEAISYANARKVFGDQLINFQNSRFKLAECLTKTRVAQSFIDSCLAALLDETLDNTTAAMAKYWITDTCGEVVDQCLQLHGAYGYTVEYPIARIYQNVRINRILAGSNEIMKEIIGRDIAKHAG